MIELSSSFKKMRGSYEYEGFPLAASLGADFAITQDTNLRYRFP